MSAISTFVWTEISGTNLSTAGVRQAQFGTDPGCVDGWGGLAIDPSTGIAYLTGGGHSDGPDNSIYRVNLSADAPAWAREADGSESADYLEYITLGGNIYKARWNADGLPVAAHVYNGWQFLAGKLYRQGFYHDFGSTLGTTHPWAPNHEAFLHAYDTATNAWLDPDALGVVPEYQNNTAGWNGSGLSSYYNGMATDGTSFYSLARNHSYGDGTLRVMRYTPGTDTWTAIGAEITADPSSGIKFGGVCCDESRGEMVRVGEGSSSIYRYNLTTGVRTVTSMTGAQSGFTASWNSSYFALARDPVNDCYWAYSGTTATDKVLRKIDPASSYACTTQSTTGTPTTVPSSGLNCRFRYIAFGSVGVLVMLPTYNSNIWACRVH